jgi:diadenosine tetraphosphate (Ap4A) HIT family hydrolase
MDQAHCPFCDSDHVLLENSLVYRRYGKSSITRGRILILPRRHVSGWFETTLEERRARLALADQARAMLIREFAPDGFDLGVNVGELAGQTMAHVHVHLIPPYRGDVAKPRDSVRGVIPDKQNY